MSGCKKPWQFNVAAVVPHRDTPELLELCLKSLAWQSERPIVYIVDTGSRKEILDKISTFQSESVILQTLGVQYWRHPSAPIAAAIDAALACVQTERAYLTHVDVYLRSKTWLAELTARTNGRHPVVGYEMSPRDWITPDWRGMVGHTSTMLYMPTVWTCGLHWTLEHAFRLLGQQPSMQVGWPDTETGFNLLCRRERIEPLLTGHETNCIFYSDDVLEHHRHYPSNLVYGFKSDAQRAEYRTRWEASRSQLEALFSS